MVAPTGRVLTDNGLLNLWPLGPSSLMGRTLDENFKIISEFMAANASDAYTPVQTYYVNTARGSDASPNNGSIGLPFATIAKASAVIGNATTNAEWNDATKRFYRIVLNGVHNGNAPMPIRPFVVLDLQAGSIVGNVTRTMGDIITSGIISPQIIIKGNGRRAVWDGSGSFVVNGVLGNINLTYTQQLGSSFFPQLHLIESGCTGDINYAVTSGDVSGIQNFLDDATIGGQINNPSNTACSVWARGRNAEQAGDIEGIGGATGKVDYLILENVVISNDVTITGTLPCQWTHVRLLNGKTFDFSGATSVVAMDGETYKEYLDAVPFANRFASVTAIDVQAAINQRTINTASPSAILMTDGLLLFDTTSVAPTIDLPAASVGRIEIPFKDIGANASINNITFNRVGADTIVDNLTGQTSTVVASNGFAGKFVSNGVDTWYLMGA